jgi:hypothetical protein
MIKGAMYALGALIAALVMYAVTTAHMHEQQRWEKFKVEHACKIVEHKDSSTHLDPVLGNDGDTSFVVRGEDAQDAWQCDDGVTYWKDAE